MTNCSVGTWSGAATMNGCFRLRDSSVSYKCAIRGEFDQAMKWLEKAYAGKDGNLRFFRSADRGRILKHARSLGERHPTSGIAYYGQ